MESGITTYAGCKPGSKLIFTGAGLWFGSGLINNFIWMSYSFLTGECGLSAINIGYLDTGFSWLSLIGLVLFWIGVENAGSHREPDGLKGRGWVRTGLLLLVFGKFFLLLGFMFLNLGQVMYENSPWAYVIQNIYHIIAWSLCAFGFLQFGISGTGGVAGKSAVRLLAAAAGVEAVYIAYCIVTNLGGPYFFWLAPVVGVVSLSLMCLGWKRLLSAWEGETGTESLKPADMEKATWRMYVGAVLNGIVLLTLASLVGQLFDTIGSLNNKIDLARGFMNGDLSDAFMPDGWDVAQWMMLIVEIIGYIIYFGGLKQFSTLQGRQDAAAVLKVRLGAILTLIGMICGHIPVIGWLVKLVLVIIGFIQMLSGYKSLKNSATFAAPSGAGTLHTALIVQLIAVILGLLPFMGFIECICDIFVFFMIVNGWSAIKKADPSACLQSISVDAEKTVNIARIPEEPETVVTEEKRQEYSEALACKSDEELKKLIREKNMYDPAFIALAREELQARILGKHRQAQQEEGAEPDIKTE